MSRKKLIYAGLIAILSLTAITPVFAETPVDTTTGSTPSGDSQTGRKDVNQTSREEVSEPDNAIGKDVAKEKALTDAGLTIDQVSKVKARVSTLEDGTVIYKVSFSYDGQKYSYQIDATTGKVLDKSVDSSVNSSKL